MTISDLEVIRFTVPRTVFHNGVVRRENAIQTLTRIATDAGAEGYYFGGGGHGDQTGMDCATRQLVSHGLKEMLVGQDPFDRERLWHFMWTRNLPEPAISVIDNALWDLAGRALEMPVYKLLGGCRDRVKAYASTYPNMGTPEDYAAHALACREQGYTHYKIHPYYFWDPLTGRAEPGGRPSHVAQDLEACRQVRAAVGPEMVPSFDPWGSYRTLEEALRVGRELQRLDFYWYEQPMLEYRVAAYERLTRELEIPMDRLGLHRRPSAGGVMMTAKSDPAALRGIFPVLPLALTADGGIDPASMERQVAFCIEAGAHGMVFPVLASEFQYLTDRERHRLVEVVIGAAAGALPVVVGVAASSAAGAVEHARHAAAAGADAVIALPPFLGVGSAEETAAYYRAIAAAARRPVFIQHTFAGMGMELINQLIDEVDEVQYVKEEMEPSAHQISALLAGVSGNCRGVFGGGHGRWMLSELRRGATGFMPATELTDLHRRIWDAWQAGDEPEARRLFNLLLPHINLTLLLGVRVCKELLVRRGVFATSALRIPGEPRLDAEDRRELEQILAAIEPELSLPLAWRTAP